MTDGTVHCVMTCQRCPWTATEITDSMTNERDAKPLMDRAYAAMMAHAAECPGG